MAIPRWGYPLAARRRLRRRRLRRRGDRRVDELPLRVLGLALERRVAHREYPRLERRGFGKAVDAGEAAIGGLHQAPCLRAGDRVGIEPPQVAHGAGLARILDQVLQALRVLALRA